MRPECICSLRPVASALRHRRCPRPAARSIFAISPADRGPVSSYSLGSVISRSVLPDLYRSGRRDRDLPMAHVLGWGRAHALWSVTGRAETLGSQAKPSRNPFSSRCRSPRRLGCRSRCGPPGWAGAGVVGGSPAPHGRQALCSAPRSVGEALEAHGAACVRTPALVRPAASQRTRVQRPGLRRSAAVC